MNRRFEELKEALFEWGWDYIEEFLGYEIDSDEEKDVTENRMKCMSRCQKNFWKNFMKSFVLSKT